MPIFFKDLLELIMHLGVELLSALLPCPILM
jgi:hypothetical protein